MANDGPIAWANWRAEMAGDEHHIIWEFHFYTDAELTADLRSGLGPYELINTVPAMARLTQSKSAEPSVVLRARDCLGRPITPFAPTTLLEWPVDGEIASLVSLLLGIRLRSGGPTRRIDTESMGVPVEWFHYPPAMPDARKQGLFLPRVIGTRDLRDVGLLLPRLPHLDGRTADALVRAAVSYQEAIWMAEADPELACIKLVGAIETAALAWSTSAISPAAQLLAAMPILAAELETVSGPTHLGSVAGQLSGMVRSTARFLAFCDAFMPPPPVQRPPLVAQLDWTRMPDHLRRVYDARSKYLHAGVPVPAPICATPAMDPTWDAPAEVFVHS